MTPAGASFYKSGGTLSPDEPSYVARQADDDLYRRLSDGQFCYVLTSRQMGKSSLMNKIATRLHREGVAVAQVDLTTIGQNLTLEQWYDGLIYEIGRCLNLKSQLRVCWQSNAALGPLQRFIATLRDGLLTTFFQPVVIFVDEIEVVRSLDFSTDEFFAAIRECYNRRAIDPEMSRLTFCLLGMATPHDLIQDPRITPFNIGTRIDLTDFSQAEARQLAAGMGEGGRDGMGLLRRVMHWTNGQPYLTQRLCQAVAENPSVVTEGAVDRLCRELFLSEHARESEPNLVPLREYVLRSAPDRAAILDIYQKVRNGRFVPINADDINLSILQLSGITRAERGSLRVRNRIYAEVFNRAWITANMPDAELRRQRAAFLRAFAINASIFGSISLLAVAAAIVAVYQYRQARAEQRRTSDLLYTSDMNRAADALAANNVVQVTQLLKAHRDDEMAGFEYGYLWNACHGDYYTFQGDVQAMTGVSFSPNNRYLACASVDGNVDILDVSSRSQVQRLVGGIQTPYAAVEFDPAGDRLAAISDRSATIWDTRRWTRSHTIAENALVAAIDYSSDGRRIAVAAGGDVFVYDTSTWTLVGRIHAGSPVYCVKFSPRSTDLATGGVDGVVRLWDSTTGRMKRAIGAHTFAVHALAFDASGRTLASAGEDHLLMLWDTSDWTRQRTISTGDGIEYSLAFVPATSMLAAAGSHTAVEFWDTVTLNEDQVFNGHSQTIRSLACSSNGFWLASASWDGSVKVWDLRQFRQVVLPHMEDSMNLFKISPDGLDVAGMSPGDNVGLWDVQNGRKEDSLRPGFIVSALALGRNGGQVAVANNQHVNVLERGSHKVLWRFADPELAQGISAIALSPDGRLVAVGGRRGEVQIWRYPGTLVTDLADGRSGDLVSSLAFSDSGGLLAAGNHAATIAIYSTDTGQLASTLVGHHSEVSALAFSHNGRELVSSGIDRSVKIWNLETSSEVLTLSAGAMQARSLAFTPDDLKLVMLGSTGTVSTWQSMSAAEVSAALMRDNGTD